MHLILLHGQEPALKAAQIPIPEGVSPAEASDAGDVYNENTIYIYGRFANIHTKNHLDVPGKYSIYVIESYMGVLGSVTNKHSHFGG